MTHTGFGEKCGRMGLTGIRGFSSSVLGFPAGSCSQGPGVLAGTCCLCSRALTPGFVHSR